MSGKIIHGAPFQPAPSILRGPFKLTISYRHWYFKVEMQDPGAGTITTAFFKKLESYSMLPSNLPGAFGDKNTALGITASFFQ